tara:strand:+ start:79 stop:621 length:543 start_codon:yes stop_codon:yes gene_type:complete
MSTRSRIGILNQNGTVESVYCHQDGYPEYTGFILENFYTNEKLVRNLLSKGDLSNIATSYNWKQEKEINEKGYEVLSVLTYAQRDQTLTSEKHDDITEFLKFDSADEYKYLFDIEFKNWLAYKTDNIYKTVKVNELFLNIPKTSRYFDFDKQVMNLSDLLLQESFDELMEIGEKIMAIGL